MDLAYAGYLLFVFPGFCLVWTYRHFTKSKKIGEFEYAAWSFLWGILIFLLSGFIASMEKTSLPTIPLNDPGATLGALAGFSLGQAFGIAFLIGFFGAFMQKLQLFNWVDKKLFRFLGKIARK